MVVLKASRPVGLNEWGQVVANAARENGPVVIWERGSQRVLATLTEHYGCEAAAINEQGQVAGLCGVSGGRARPVIWQRDGTIRELGVVWGDRGQAKVSRVKKLAGFRAGLT
jgi:uncharacterized membrane protein